LGQSEPTLGMTGATGALKSRTNLKRRTADQHIVAQNEGATEIGLGREERRRKPHKNTSTTFRTNAVQYLMY